MKSCATCGRAVVPAKEKYALETNWLNVRGLAYCAAYREKLGRRFLITLVNAAGPVCGGRDFVGKAADLFDNAETAAV